MEFTPVTEIAVRPVAPAKSTKKNGAVRLFMAAAVSIGLMVPAAIPAYAVDSSGENAIAYAIATGRTGNVQNLVTSPSELKTAIGESVQALKTPVVVDTAGVTHGATNGGVDNGGVGNGAELANAAARNAAPSGVGVALVAAARAQIGVYQDCTDLVQNSLAAVGLFKRRDQGGYDLGPMDFARFGTRINPADAQPGDIMMRGGHVAIYAGNGRGVHGGWTNGSTVEAGGNISNPAAYAIVVRLP
ncbi:MAG: hypothetical protein Q4C71_02325 [Microbacteriaceae bacterium]|nr:hypothetical protein [Microbacteriaceae bacterium]